MKVNARKASLAAAFAAVAVVVVVLVVLYCMVGPDLMKKSQAKRLAREQLIDPDSAQFRNMAVSAKGNIVCGEVNSKNRMGGYVGYQPFFVVQGKHFRFAPEENSLDFDKMTWFGGLHDCYGSRS